MIRGVTRKRVLFVTDMATGDWTLEQLAEKHGIAYVTAKRWRASPWAAKLLDRLGEMAVTAARNAIKRRALKCVENISKVADMAGRSDAHELRGLETIRKANRDLLEALGLVGPENSSTATVQNVQYVTTVNETGRVETTAVASGPNGRIQADNGRPRALPRPGNGNEVG